MREDVHDRVAGDQRLDDGPLRPAVHEGDAGAVAGAVTLVVGDADLGTDVGPLVHRRAVLELCAGGLGAGVGTGGDATPLHAGLAHVGHDRAGVEVVHGGDAGGLEPRCHLVGELAGDGGRGVDAVGLEALLADAVVADERVGEGENLSLVGRVGQRLLVARVGRREDQFAPCPPGCPGPPLENGAVLHRDVGLGHYEPRIQPAA